MLREASEELAGSNSQNSVERPSRKSVLAQKFVGTPEPTLANGSFGSCALLFSLLPAGFYRFACAPPIHCSSSASQCVRSAAPPACVSSLRIVVSCPPETGPT